MDNTVNSTDNSENIGGLAYGIGVSLGILVLILTITIVSYLCIRLQTPSNSSPQNALQFPAGEHSTAIELGLDEATLLSFPKLSYHQVKLHKGDAAACCTICLVEYADSDMLRLLPDCGHLFHLKCVDPWLRLHPSCPICRSSPLPTPTTTPLAEAALGAL